MISIIVPVYNVQPYLPKCLNSILNQTCSDLEILLIDDGSTDCSGDICDRYAEIDSRIRVFHTKNRGLSAARNLGLDHAKGEYIGFVDSDDWIELDMYEVLLHNAEETGADIVECGFYIEYAHRIVEQKNRSQELTGLDAIQALLKGDLADAIWCKLSKRHLFDIIRFPEGRVFEEIATTYRLFYVANTICTVEAAKYHYIRHSGGISQIYNIQNLIGCWLSNKERYLFLNTKLDDDSKQLMLQYCAFSIARTWAHYCGCDKEDREQYKAIVEEMNAFTRKSIPIFGDKKWEIGLRVGVVFPHFYNTFSFEMASLAYRLYKMIFLHDYESLTEENPYTHRGIERQEKAQY